MQILLLATGVDWGVLPVALELLLLLLLVGASASFSGSETVLFSLTPAQLQHELNSLNPLRRRAARLMANPKKTLLVILLGNTAVNVFIFSLSFTLFENLSHRLGPAADVAGAVFAMAAVLVGGEVVPKIAGVRLAPALVPYAAAYVSAVSYVLWPIAKLLDVTLVDPLTRLILGATHGRVRELSNDELKILLEMSRRQGLIDPSENSFLRQVVDLHFLRVSDVMVPRVEVQAFDVAGSPEKLRDLIARTRLKKIPVYEGSIDNIVGLVYAKILFLTEVKQVRDVLMPIKFVPQNADCEQLLAHFRSTRTQLAIAVDEYGGMAGLVTLENVLEAIVGELHDPEDQQTTPEIVALSDTAYDVSGGLSVHFWAETFGLPRLTAKVATVGGLITAQLGRPARVGDTVRINNVKLRVTAVQRRRVERVQLELISGAAA